MRYVTVGLIVLLGLVHAEIWFGKGGMPRMLELQGRVATLKASNTADRQRNAQLDAEVRDLKEGLEMVEKKARFELGMIKPDEIYVQLIATQVPTR